MPNLLAFLTKAQVIYFSDPEVLVLPHGEERLRKAYQIYLAEEEDAISYQEFRRSIMEMVGNDWCFERESVGSVRGLRRFSRS
jgi:hypothetical protein